jgi:basic membrane protein A
MKKKLLVVLSLLIIAAFVLVACAPAAPEEPEAPEAPAIKACQVTDTGGIDDKSFNATAWKGVEDVQRHSLEGCRRRSGRIQR